MDEKLQKKFELFRLKLEEKKLKKKIKERNKKKKKIKKKPSVKYSTKDIIIKKRKVGRPKKRGPKKKRIRRKKIEVIKKYNVFDFKIVSVLNGKQNGYVGCYNTYTDAYQKMKELEELNNNVIFPRKLLNSGNINLVKEEYLVLEKNRNGDKSDGLLRNSYGKFVTQKITNNSKWVIRDKMVKLVEETFWVYGYDPKVDRKTFSWIYENLLINSINSKYDIIRILSYKNKLVIKYDEKPMSIVMCKNKSDCIRLYNLISEKLRKEKIKQIICTGSYDGISESRRELEAQIMELTGWNKIKIQRSTN